MSQLSLASLFLSTAMVFCSYIFATKVQKAIPSNEVVKVRGVAERSFESDRVDWSITVSAKNPNLDAAYTEVDKNMDALVSFLKKENFPESVFVLGAHFQSRQTKRRYTDDKGNYEDDMIGFEVSRSLKIEKFENLDLVESTSKKVNNALARKGIAVRSGSPYFFYSKPVKDIKPDLLTEAAKSAFQRATIIAKNSGSKIGALRAARQGVFSGFNSDGFVGGSARKHNVSAVVTVDYSLK
jgi:hypothetical protein